MRQRPPVRRVVRRRPSLIEELTDDIEPDEGTTIERRLTALALLILAIGVLAAGVWFVIVSILARTT